jgi:phage repressor protein C with HTH and peptisase S24 domain
MSGFGKKQEKKSKTKVINEDEYDKLMKKYKRIKRFMNSPLHEVKRIDGEKTIVEELLDEYHEELDDYYEKNPEPEEEEYDEHYAQESVDYQAGLTEFLSKRGNFHEHKDNGKSGGFE